MDFRGEGLVNAIHLSWDIRWRRFYNTRDSFEPRSHKDWSEVGMGEVLKPGGAYHIAPNSMLRLIWRVGEAEPAEEMISAAFTSYIVEDLREFGFFVQQQGVREIGCFSFVFQRPMFV